MRNSIYCFILNITLFILFCFCSIWTTCKTAEKIRDYVAWHKWGIIAAIISGITASHFLFMITQ